MKKLAAIFVLIFFAQTSFAQVNLTVNIKFGGIEEGFDHQTKTSVFIDDQEVGTSGTSKESQTGSFTVSVPKGQHTLKVVNYSLYEGNWEEHTIANDYSIDCFYEESHSFKKTEKLFILFDLNSGTHASWKKPVKLK